MTALTPRAFSAWTSKVAVVRFPIAPSVPRIAILGHVTSKIRPENRCRSRLAFGRRTSVMVTTANKAARHELGVVVEELVQAVDDVHPAGDAVEQHDPLLVRQQAVGRRQPTDQVVRYAAGVRDGLGERRQHRDAVRGAVKEFAGIDSGPEAVDDAE